MMKISVTNNSVISNHDSLSVISTRKADFAQLVADNPDDNISMLNGKNTYRIIAVSNAKLFNFCTRIPREKRKSTNQTTAGKTIPIKQYLLDGIKSIVSVKLKSIKDIDISSDI